MRTAIPPWLEADALRALPRLRPEATFIAQPCPIRESTWICYAFGMLAPTPADRLVDAQGRPYFLWDCEMTLDELRARLADPDPEVRAYLIGKLMRQAKPDDVFTFVSAREIRALWSRLERHLGKTRPFWTWLFATWESQGHVFR